MGVYFRIVFWRILGFLWFHQRFIHKGGIHYRDFRSLRLAEGATHVAAHKAEPYHHSAAEQQYQAGHSSKGLF